MKPSRKPSLPKKIESEEMTTHAMGQQFLQQGQHLQTITNRRTKSMIIKPLKWKKALKTRIDSVYLVILDWSKC